MTIDTHVQDHLRRYAASVEPGEIIEASEIGVHAKKRDRRNRSMGGLATIAVAALLVVGVGTALRSPEENAVFVGGTVQLVDGQVLVPSDVVFDGERFVGVAPIDAFDLTQAENQQFVVVTSEDGLTWERARKQGSFVGTSVTLAHHEGQFFVVATQIVPPVPGTTEARFELGTARSTNLTDWQGSSQVLNADLVPDGTRPVVLKTVAAEAGLLAQLSVWPDHFASMEDTLEREGYDPDELCEQRSTSTHATFRVCGTSEEIRLPLEPEVPLSSPERKVLFSPTDGEFELITLPETDQGQGGPGFVRIYSLPVGFGVSGAQTFESTNGITWTEADTAQDVGPMVAARGDEEVFALPFGVQRFGPDDPVLGFAYRRGEGEWQSLELDSLYDETRSPRWFTDLQAGPAGWTMVAQRSFAQRQLVEGVERDRSGESDFTLTADGYVLAGHYPFGPAILTGPDGAVVRSWDHFEATRPEWSGFTSNEAGISLIDEETGEPNAVFSFEQWNGLTHPLNAIEYDLLYSPDGQTWQIIDTGTPMPKVLAIGEGQLIVQHFLHNGFSPSQPIVKPISLPSND